MSSRPDSPDSSLPLIRDVVQRITAYLSLMKRDSPRLSAELLTAEALGCERQDLFAVLQRPMSRAEEERALKLAERRGRGEPVAYILGRKEFYAMDFAVTPDTLIPRPETEHLVEAALEHFAPREAFRFADLGTGCGAIAGAVAAHRESAQGFALDLSGEALSVARQNFRAHGVEQRVACVRADMGDLPWSGASLDLVLANPPYVSTGEYAGLSQEIVDFEPRLAFVGRGETPPEADDGLDVVRALLPEAARALKPGGLLLMELGSGQGDAALALARSMGPVWSESAILRDLAGLDRVLRCTRS